MPLSADATKPYSAPSRRRSALLWLLLLILCITVAQLVVAAWSADRGRRAASEARAALAGEDIAAFARNVDDAEAHFGRAADQLGSPNPLLLLARGVPYVRLQLECVRELVGAGEELAQAGNLLSRHAAAAYGLGLEDGTAENSVSHVLLTAQPDAARAVRLANAAETRLARLKGLPLLEPLAKARDDALSESGEAVQKVRYADAAVTAAIDVMGLRGGRNFLLFSQNPDEPRPGGGFVGTYGLLTSKGGNLRLARYAAISQWSKEHPEAAIPSPLAPFVLRRADQPQRLENFNTTPDWPSSARTASEIWRRGGEAPVDGVITYLPGMLKRAVAVLGSVQVPGYPDIVTSENLDERLEYYTHREEIRQQDAVIRKRFVVNLAQVIAQRSLQADAETTIQLARGFVESAVHREAALWSTDASTQRAFETLGVDGGFHATPGDFYHHAEFAYESKIGRSLKRTFEHEVILDEDGSGTTSTRITVENTAGPDIWNAGPDTLLTPYGPLGGRLVPPSDPPLARQQDLKGHRSAMWRLNYRPLSTTSLTAAWRAPALALPRPDGTWDYRLTFVPTPGHVGDRLRLKVTLPPGWEWVGAQPAAVVRIDEPYEGTWQFRRVGRAQQSN